MLALDISFSASKVTPEWCAARLAEGYELLWVDAWTGKQSPQGVEQALRYWREAGGYIGAYGCIHDGRPAAQHYASAKAAIGNEWPYLSFFAIDCEIDFCSPSAVLAVAGYVERDGGRPVVYSAYWFWAGHMGNPTDCASLPLIDASYGIEPSLTMYRPYGGWSTCVGHQYQNTTDLGGIDVDISLFDDAWVQAEHPVPTPVPAPSSDRQQFVNSSRGWADKVAAGTVADSERPGAAAEYRTMAEWLEQGLV